MRIPLERLGRMSIAEVAYRGRQEVSKRWERLGLLGRVGGVRALGESDLAGFRDRLREVWPGTCDGSTPTLLRERCPGALEEVVAAADALCRGEFSLLGYPSLSFSEPLDWRLDPVSGRRSPLVHWSRIDPLDAAAVGDSKVVWELNRHQWFGTLGQAFRLTGDERYAEAFARHVTDWLRGNPEGLGINWSSSLELSFRIVSWSFALAQFQAWDGLTPGLFREVVSSIAAHAARVARYLSVYFSPNTHLTGEALGLVCAGTLFPELKDAPAWRQTGLGILDRELSRQVLSDGWHFELATCYQKYTAEIYLHAVLLAPRGLPSPVLARVQELLDVLVALQSPGAEAPSLGDADGGSVLPLQRRAPGDARGLFSTAAALFRRGDYAWASGGLASETLWLLGAEGARAFDVVPPAPPSGAASRLFAEGGYAVLRSGWGEEDHRVILDVGPLGCPVTGAHGHADLLSVQCAFFGEEAVVDPGTFAYTPDPLWRNHFRSTRAHNTLTLDGRDQAIPAGTFAWVSRPGARLRRFASTPSLDFVEAEHDAFSLPGSAIRHVRRVVFVKPWGVLIVDDVVGTGAHSIEVRFQFPPVSVVLLDRPWARAAFPGGRGLLVATLPEASVGREVLEGALDPPEGWVSPDYGQRRPAPVLVCRAEGRLPLRVATLLLPVTDVSQDPPPLEVLEDAAGAVLGVVVELPGRTLTFDASPNPRLDSGGAPCAASSES